MKILVADDHGIVRSGLKRMLEAGFPNVVVGEAASCRELLDQVTSSHWDELILDVALGAESGLAA